MVIQAGADKREKVIEFINRVFNEDFETLHEKLYSKENSFLMNSHYIIEEGEKIVGAICMERIAMQFGGKKLNVGVIGSVSVDAECRGKGYMRELMEHVLKLADIEGLDMIGLYGNTERYRHYGFEPLGLAMIANFDYNTSKYNANKDDYSFDVATDDDVENMYNLYGKQTVRTLRKRERFMAILRTWRCIPYIIKQRGKFFGYLVYNEKANGISEIVLKNNGLKGEVISAFNVSGSLKFEFYSSDLANLDNIERFCEGITLNHCANIKILNEGNVLSAFGKNKKCGFKMTDILRKGGANIFIPRIDNI